MMFSKYLLRQRQAPLFMSNFGNISVFKECSPHELFDPSG